MADSYIPKEEEEFAAPCSHLPATLLPLFDGGIFDSEYNPRFPIIEFEGPPNLCRAVIIAVITGEMAAHLNTNASMHATFAAAVVITS